MLTLEKKNSKQVDKKRTKQVLIDASVHNLLKIKSKQYGESLGSLVEGALAGFLGSRAKGVIR